MLPLLIGGAAFATNAYAAYKKGEISREEYKQAISQAAELERQLKTLRPDATWRDLDPKLLSEVAKYSPDVAAFVQENAPELIQEAGSATEKRVQREALQKYSAMAESGRDVISEAQREQALFETDARSKQRQRAIMESLRRQGQLGSGAGLQAQLSAEQAEAVNARQAALQGVQEAEMRRRQALGQAAGLAGQIRGQNLNVESANVGTMNAYNQRLANARNMYNQYASNERNRAQIVNQQREMERERYNLGLQNQYAMYNRQQRDAARERARQYDADLASKMYGIRQGAEAKRFDGRRQEIADYATAVTSGLGAGMSAYGLSSAGAGGIGKAAVDGLARGAAYQGGQQLVNSMFSSPVDTTPQYMGPVPAQSYVQQFPQTRNVYMGGPWRPQGDNEFIDVEQDSFELQPYTRRF